MRTENLQTHLHALERLDFPTKDKTHYFVPVRFLPNEKITKTSKLLLAFDALVLSIASGKMPPFGKIIHGRKMNIVKVQLARLMETVKKTVRIIAARQESLAAPETVLKTHCAECEHHLDCRREAMDKDSLSLLAGISEKERGRLKKRGITTVTQLSYAFRPRRKPPQVASQPRTCRAAGFEQPIVSSSRRADQLR